MFLRSSFASLRLCAKFVRALSPTGLAIMAAVASVALPALAHPVRIGRYAEIPYGIDPAHPYPTWGGGPRRNGRVRGVAPAVAPVQLWERTLRHRRPRGPIVASDGTLYVGTMGGLTALGPDGVERWSASLGAVHATPSFAPGGEVVAVTRGGLVALVSPEGVVRHTRDLGAPARGSALVLDDGSVLVGTIDGVLHRLDANLRPVFAVPLEVGAGSTISLAARGLVAVPTGRTLNLLDTEGHLRDQVALGGVATSPAAVADDGTLWVPTVDGVLLAIEPTGRVRSRTELGSRHYDGAAPGVGQDGAVRVPTLTEGLVCVGPGGTERWRLPNAAGYNAPVSLDEEDTALVIDRGGRLLAIAADGSQRWQVTIGTYSFQAPVLGGDGTIYVTTEQGALQAWRAP